MNRLCPSENILSEYLAGILPEDSRKSAEKHLANCRKCRETLKDAYIVTSKKGLKDGLFVKAHSLKRHFWLLSALISLFLSVLFRGYFVQFLVLSLICALAWSDRKHSLKNVIHFTSPHSSKEKITKKN